MTKLLSIKIFKHSFKIYALKFKIARRRLLIPATLLLIIGIPIVYILNNVINNTASAAWYDDNWLYRKSIAIATHTTSENNVYINLTGANDIDTGALISAGKMQGDCGDLRFTKQNGELLPYYVVSGCNSADTVVHVLFDNFPAGAQTYYYYYGNPSAANGFSSSDFSTVASNYSFGTLGTEENAPSPVLYFAFDEGQGTTVYDSSTNKYNGAFSGSPTWQTEDLCISGKCLYFPGGTSGSVTVSNTVSNVKSISFWVRPATSSAAMVEFDNSTHYISSDNNGAVTATGFTSPTYYINGKQTSSPTLSANSWTHVQITTATSFNATAIKVGNYKGDYLKGFVDEFKIYDYARDANQVKTDYASRGSVKGASALLGGGGIDSSQVGGFSQGLVGYWKMDESATPSTDSSGNGNSGTWTGGAKNYAGKFDNSISQSASGDYVSVANSASLQITGALSLSAWASPSANMSIASKALMVKNNSYRMVTDGSGNPVCQINDGTNWQTAATSSVALTKNTWQLVTCTYDQQNIRVFVNGDLKGTSALTSAIGSNTNPLRIGSDEAGTYTDFFQGGLDEARIYNRAFSPKEVRDLYNFAPGPFAYYKMDENTGTTTLSDSSGNGYNGTMTYMTNSDWIPGKYGTALNFRAASDTENCVDIYSAGLYNAFNTSQGALMAWVKIPTADIWSDGAGHQLVLLRGGPNDGDTDNQVFIRKHDTNNTIRVSYQAGGTSENLDYTTTSTDWMHVAITWDKSGDIVKAYVNGVFLDSKSTLGTWDATKLQPLRTVIGAAKNTCRTFPGKGYIDEVKIYNYARTPKQVVEDMNAGAPAVSSKSPIGYWDLDEGQGTIANDASGNSNPLTLSSASWTNSGKIGRAWNGDGTKWVSKTTDSDLEFAAADDLSISLWYKSDSADNPTNGIEYLASDTTGNTDVGFNIYANTTGTICFGIDDDTTSTPPMDISSCTATDYYDGAWHHLLAVRNTTLDKIYLYIDGKEADSDTDPTTATLDGNNTFYLGDFDGDNNATLGIEEFAGDLDEVKVYRYALTEDEVKTEYNQGKSLVLGALGNNSTYQSQAANQEYCVPGDTTSCAAPVGEWDFEEGKDNTCTGGSNDVCDTSGNGNDGAWNGGSTIRYTPGKIGKAGQFNGTDDYADAGNGSSLNISTAITVEAWIKLNSLDANPHMVVGRDDGSSRDYGLQIAGSNANFFTFKNDNAANRNITASTTLSTGTWYHIAATYSSTGKTNIYINGKSDATELSDSGNIDTDSVNVYIGNRKTDRYFNGFIDSIRIFNYARTPAQIAWDYNRGAPVAHWDFDECSGTIIHDLSGNSYNGTWSAGTTYTGAGTCTDGLASSAWYGGRTGKFNTSLDFDGTASNKVTIGTAISGVQSVSFWVKPATNSDSFMDLDGGTHYITASSGIVSATGFASPTIYVNGVPNGTATGGAWNHIVVITGTSFDTTSNFTMGYKSAAPADYLTGQLDDIRVYNYALTSTQVKNEYNQGAAVRFGPNAGQP